MVIVYQQIYRKLEKIFGKDWYNLSHVILQNQPYMKLYFEKLDHNRFALAHYFEQNGDLVADPDMEFKVYPDKKMVEALSYQDSLGYRRVYPYPGDFSRFNIREKNQLNRFLSFWLGNLITQGFQLTALKI